MTSARAPGREQDKARNSSRCSARLPHGTPHSVLGYPKTPKPETKPLETLKHQTLKNSKITYEAPCTPRADDARGVVERHLARAHRERAEPRRLGRVRFRGHRRHLRAKH